MASEAEEFILRLNEQVSPAARVAESAIAQLEAQIASNQSALQEYESELVQAKQKLEDMGQAAGRDRVSIAAYRRQQRAVEVLGQKAEDARQALNRLGGAKPMAEQVTQFQKAEQAIRSAADALEELRAKQQLVASGGGDVSGFTARIDAQRAAVIRAQQAYVRMGGSARVARNAGGSVGEALGGLSAKAKRAELDLGQLDTSFSALGGVAGESGARVAELGEAFQMLRAMGPAALVAGIVIVVAALAVALVAATVAAVKWAVSMADGARTQRLTLESLRANYAALAGIEEMMPRVAARSGLAREEISGLAEDLAKAKVPAENMEAALSAMATAKAGGANADFLAKLEAGLKSTGKVPPQLAEQFSRFENIARAKMLSLDSISMRLRENASELFADLDIEPLLAGLESVLSIFDTTTAEGKALRDLLTIIFQPMVDFAVRMLPKVERKFYEVAIAAMEAYLEIKAQWDSPMGAKFRKGLELIKEAFQAVGVVSDFVANHTMVRPLRKAAEGAFMLVAAIGSLHGMWATVSASASAAWKKVVSSVDNAIASIKGKSLTQIGVDMMLGLASGIVKGGAKVFQAIADVVGGAIKGAEKMLERKSPSRVFMRIGADTSEGMAIGVRDRAPRVQAEMAAMVRVPAVLAANDNAKAWGASTVAPVVDAAREAGVQVVARDGSSGALAGSTSTTSSRTIEVNFSGCTFTAGLTEGDLRKMLQPILESVFEDESAAVEDDIEVAS